MSRNVLAVIPARYASTRFPGKPLALLAGRPMIQHVYERAKSVPSVSEVLVATDDDRIVKAVQLFGGTAVMTRPDHNSGTDRVAEIATRHPADIYVNVQGDEPLLDPSAIAHAVESMVAEDEILIGTLRTRIQSPEDLWTPNVVKVVLDFDENALYFSRAPIPWVRESSDSPRVAHWKHIGVYLYRRSALLDFPALPPGELEAVERLEQLRWLENGFKVRAFETSYNSLSVDTTEDLAAVEKVLSEKTPKVSG